MKHQYAFERNSRIERVGIWVLLLLMGLFYLRVVGFPFTNWDDPYLVYQNLLVTYPSLKGVVSLLGPNFHLTFLPLPWLSYMVDGLLWGLKPYGFHLTNLLIFMAGVYFLYRIFSAIKSPRLALLALVLFAFHPLVAEPLAWISGRKDLMAFLFGNLSICFLLEERYPLVTIFFLLALLSKGNAAILPVAYFMILKAGDKGGSKVRNWVMLWWGMTVFFLVYGFSMPSRGENWVGYVEGSMLTTLFTMLSVYRDYMVSVFFPVHLSPYYVVKHYHTLFALPVLTGLFLIMGQLSLAFWLVKKGRKAEALGLVLFLCFLLPYMQIIPVGALRADRYLLMGLPWLIFALASLVENLFHSERGWVKRVSRGLIVTFLILFLPLSWLQCSIWSSSISLWSHALKMGNKDSVVLANLGVAYWERGDYEKAYKYLKEAYELDSKDPTIERDLKLIEKYINIGMHPTRTGHGMKGLHRTGLSIGFPPTINFKKTTVEECKKHSTEFKTKVVLKAIA